MGEIRLFPGLLAPPAGLDFLLDLPSEEGLHLVAFAEGALDALKVAFQEGARSLVLLSPKERPVDPSAFASKARYSPWAGWVLGGWPVLTLVAGRNVDAALK